MTQELTAACKRYFQGDLPLIYAEVYAEISTGRNIGRNIGISTELQVRNFNSFTRKLVGIAAESIPFAEFIVDFSGTLDPFSLAKTPERAHLLSVSVAGRTPLGFLCSFWPASDHILLLGAADASEQLRIQNQILMLNRQLSTMTRDLHQSNAELSRVNELKNQFLGMAAHDLRNPLGSIKNFGEFLLDEAASSLTEEQLGFLDAILCSSRSMLRIVEDFLDVSKIESGHLEIQSKSVEFAQARNLTLTVVRPKADRKQVMLKVEDGTCNRKIHMDADRIAQVLINLISNAIEHSYPGTTVTIRTAFQDGLFHCAVIDQGVGIPEEHLSTLFDPFEKKFSRKTGGEPSTGLGLVISKKVIEAHGGRITVRSQQGQGATFSFCLPLHPSDNGEADEPRDTP